MRLSWLLLCLLCVIVPHRSYAQSDDTRGVIIVAAEAKERSIVLQAVAPLLRAAGWNIKDETFTEREVKAALNCLPSELAAGCLKGLLKAKQASRVAIVALKLDPTTNELAISGRLMVPGVRMAPFEQRFCERCTDDILAAHIEDLTRKLLGQLAVYSGRTVIEVTSVPSGATIFLDGQPAGVTPAKHPVAPGVHAVRIEAPGYVAAERQVSGVDGRTARVEVVLQSAGGAVVPASVVAAPLEHNATASSPTLRVARKTSGQPSRVGPGLLMATGGLAIVGGGIALALNETAPVAPAGQEQPRTYTSTLLPGSVAVGGGLLAVGVGYLWWKAASKQPQPVIAASANGAVVGVAGTF